MVVLSAIVGIGVGAIYMVIAKPYTRSDAISADVIRTTSDPSTSDQVSEK